jgi:hypothetical protein
MACDGWWGSCDVVLGVFVLRMLKATFLSGHQGPAANPPVSSGGPARCCCSSAIPLESSPVQHNTYLTASDSLAVRCLLSSADPSRLHVETATWRMTLDA